MRNKKRIKVLLHHPNSSELAGLGFLRNLTDDEMMSIFRIKGLTNEARDNIVPVLYDIHNEDVSTHEHESSTVHRATTVEQ
jgi:hypothetical protein